MGFVSIILASFSTYGVFTVFIINVHVNELFEFCLIYEKISGTTNYSYSIETMKQSFLYLQKKNTKQTLLPNPKSCKSLLL